MGSPRPTVQTIAAKKAARAVLKATKPKIKNISSWNYPFAGVRAAEYVELEAGLTSVNDPGAVIRNRLYEYYRQDNFEDRILQVYTRSNKAIAKVEGMTPVKIGHSKYGWLTEEGDLIRQSDVGYALKSVDAALGAYDDPQFYNAFKNATPKQRALIANELRKEIDWDAFWKESYDPNTGVFYEGSEDEIVRIIKKYIPDFEYVSEWMDPSEFFENY